MAQRVIFFLHWILLELRLTFLCAFLLELRLRVFSEFLISVNSSYAA